MSKIIPIIQREYLTRVNTKAFLISTLLLPLGLVLLMILPVIASQNVEEEAFTVFVEDPSGKILPQIESKGGLTFLESHPGPEGSQKELQTGEVAIFLDSASLKTRTPLVTQTATQKLSLQVEFGIKSRLEDAIRKYKTQLLGLSPSQYEDLNQFQVNVLKKGAQADEGGAKIAAIVGYAMAFLIYIMMIMYGMFVMRGVIEEKTSRIVEVMISSVKPFQLMLGKLLGICAVGITQLILWIALLVGLMQVMGGFLANSGAAGTGGPDIPSLISMVLATLSPGLILLFIFYFLGGFLIYGSLFAAVGSAVDQETDAQQFTFPVLLPLILPMVLLGNILQNPNGTLSIFMSQFPLTSPTVMMVRLSSTDVPWYDLLASMLFMLIGIVFFVWLASRIYRVGILMYGKKPSFREIGKWIFRN